MFFIFFSLLASLSIIYLILLFRSTIWSGFSYYILIPAKITKVMNEQGIYGPPRRFLIGNLLDISSMVSKSTKSDMSDINHDILPRLYPYYLKWSERYGDPFLFWNSSEPRLCLTDTDMIKEFLSSKFIHTTGRSWLQKEGSKQFIGRGVLMANGQEWQSQRHVISPIFMGEKLKVSHQFLITK